VARVVEVVVACVVFVVDGVVTDVLLDSSGGDVVGTGSSVCAPAALDATQNTSAPKQSQRPRRTATS
jgi:hypothetical protein